MMKEEKTEKENWKIREKNPHTKVARSVIALTTANLNRE